MAYINKKDTEGTKPLLAEGELGYDKYAAGGDVGRVYVGTGSENIALSQKAELDTHKADVANPHSVTKSQVGLGNVDNESKATMFTNPTFTGTVTGVSKAMVGLGNVDNTSDVDKPISTAQATAINGLDFRLDTAEADIISIEGTLESSHISRADKWLAAQSVANMLYTDGKLSKVRYNTDTDTDYEVMTYVSEKLSNVAHYTSAVLRGNTVLSYTDGKLVSAIYTGV